MAHTQPNKPKMVMEFWTGWFDHWGEEHLQRNIKPDKLKETIAMIFSLETSINFYMFHGKYSTFLSQIPMFRSNVWYMSNGM